MSLVRHPNSPYWYMSFMVNGKTIFRSTKTTNKSLAQKIENEARKQELESVHFERKESVTLADIIRSYLETRGDSGRLANDQTYAKKLLGTKTNPSTRKQVDVYGLDGTMLFHELTTKELFRLVAARRSEGNSQSTIIQELLFINGLIKTAHILGYQTPDIDVSAFKKSQKLQQGKKPIRYLTAEEESRLLAALDPKLYIKGIAKPENQSEDMRRMRQDAYDFVVVLLDTGARYDEIGSIRWEQVDLENRLIRVFRSKVKNDSVLHMTDRLYDILKRRSENKHSDDYVFTAKDGGPRKYNPRSLQSAIKRAGIQDCSFHTMRKTLASKLVRGGLAISDVSSILGHASVTTTATYYASLSPAEASKRALAILN